VTHKGMYIVFIKVSNVLRYI